MKNVKKDVRMKMKKIMSEMKRKRMRRKRKNGLSEGIHAKMS